MPTPFTPVQEQINAYFPRGTHPWNRLNAAIEEALTPESVVLDIGCGRRAPNLARLVGKAKELHGIDLVPFAIDLPDLHLHSQSVSDMPEIASASVDLAYSRAVMEHIEDVDTALDEIRRVLKPGGRYIFLTPSIYDYASIIAAIVPNAGIRRSSDGRRDGRRRTSFRPSSAPTAGGASGASRNGMASTSRGSNISDNIRLISSSTGSCSGSAPCMRSSSAP